MEKPKIRFKGYQEDWEQRKLIDLVDVLDGDRGKNYPTSDDFDISGHTLFLNASNVTNDGFLFQDNQFITEEKSNSMGNGKLEEDDIVVTSRGSLGHIAWYNADISSFVPYARINSGMLILRNKKEIETEYLYHFMKSSKGQSQISFISFGSAQPQLTKKGVEDLEVILPTRRDEQVQLGHYFSNLDNLITLHQRKCEETKILKKYMLQKMFPQNGHSVPEIRFSGCTEDWEQRKFGEIVEKYEDPIETPTEGYTRLGIRSHAKGTFHSYVEKGKELETAKMFRVAADKFIVNITFGWEHAVAITDENDAGKLVSHRFPQYSFNAGMEPKFFRYLILDENFKHHLELSSPGGAGRNRVLKLSDMLQYKMNFPSEAEQKKIAAYFDDLDHLITLHQRKCEQTKTLKKYMLQKMFPQDGEKVPQIRFEGFTEDWEQRKLSEIALQTYGGGTPKTANEEFWKGNIPWIQSSDLIEERLFNVKPRKYISQEAISKSSTKLVPQNSIAIVTRVGVGKLAFMPFSYATSQDFLSLSELKIEPKFAVYALYKMMRLVSNEVQGTSIKGITKDELLAKEILIPDCEEQKKIGAYLHNLDHLITLHQRKCDELKEVKKFMLQNMFV